MISNEFPGLTVVDVGVSRWSRYLPGIGWWSGDGFCWFLSDDEIYQDRWL